MAEMIIRPTLKFLFLGYLLAFGIVVASVVALMRIQLPARIPLGIAALDSLAAGAPFAVAVKAPSSQSPDQDDDP